ncbi:MAG: PAS domain-containing protein, partial [Oscillochloris sp.]|nr:PAS domain-containing protein [Oscillochloris sp.]
DLRQILAGGDQIERQVGTPDGRWFQLRVRPILNEQQARVGVVLMYIDISELKRAQELAIRSEQRLRGAIESSLDAFYLFESVRNVRGEISDFRVIEVNQVGADRLKTPRDALPGQRVSEVLTNPSVSNAIIRDYRPVVESGRPLTRDQLTDMGDEIRWFRQQVVKVSDGVAISSADITEQKRFEAEREAQRLRLDLALDGGGLGTWEVNVQTAILASDIRAMAILGLQDEQSEQHWEYWRQRIHPDDMQRMDTTLMACLNGEAALFEIELRVRHQDGTWRWLLSRGRVVAYTSHGSPLRMAGTYMDITERVLAEERLRASERRYQTLSEIAPMGIYRTDTHGAVTYVNPRWCEIVGISIDAAMHTGWQHYLHPDDAAVVIAHWEKVIISQRESQLEFRYLRPNGETCWVLSLAAPEIDEHGDVVGYVGTLIDISRRIAAEERLRQQSAQLEAANTDLARAARLKDQFLANMSHELRTPLTGVLGFSEALSQGIYGEINSAQQRAIQHIFDNGQHLLSLINDILDLARIGAGQVDLKLGPVIVDDVCVEAINLIGPMMKAKAQRFTYTRPAVGLTIEADVLRLRQILINLLSNAVKFTPEGGELGMEITLDSASQLVRFTVWDHGIGIAPAQQAFLFQPFVQLDNRLAREQTGTGLGLALVRQLTTLHGGSIELQSTLGAGSTFTVALPQHNRAVAEDMITWATANAPTSALAVDRGLILLAEDDSSVAALLHDYLQAQGYATMHVNHGDEVLPRLRSSPPQLILIDIQLPGMSGLEIIARLRADANQNLARTPIIAVTALAMIGDRERCLAAGANDYLSKPIRLDELGVMITRVLTTHQA